MARKKVDTVSNLEVEDKFKDPEFLKLLGQKGFVKADPIAEDFIIFSDGVKRKMSWGYKTLGIMAILLRENGIEDLQPLKEHLHFALLLYCMLIEDMVDTSTGLGGPNFLDFEAFLALMPTDMKDLERIVQAMDKVFGKNNKVMVNV